MNDELLDEIYEAAVIPSEWPRLLERTAKSVGGEGGVLFTASSNGVGWLTSPSLRQVYDQFREAGWVERNSRAARTMQRNLTGFTITDHDLFSNEELESEPLYAFLRQRGYGWCMGFTTQVPSGETLAISYERRFAAGPYQSDNIELLESLRGHLSRAMFLSARLGLERAKAAAEAMGLIGLPTAVLSSKFRLTTSNALFEHYMPTVLFDGRDRLRLRDARADALLLKALESLEKDLGDGAPLSVPVAATDQQSAMVLHVVPVRRAANDIFSGASCLAVITPLDRKKVPSAILIQGLFDLTGAEARVARLIGAGYSINEIAAQNGVGVGTVRNQVKSIFSKTGLSRQADLVAMIGNITL